MKAFVLVAVLVLLGPGQAMVQDTPDIERFFPRRGFMLSGSGGASYNAVFADGAVSLNVSAYKTSFPTRLRNNRYNKVFSCRAFITSMVRFDGSV